MKRTRSLVELGLSLLLVLIIVGCGNNATDKNKVSDLNKALTKVGQYHPHSGEPKETLVAINSLDKKVNLNGIEIHFTKARLRKEDAKTQKQLKYSNTSFGKKLSKHYYVYQLDYSAKNTTNQPIMFGDNIITTPSGVKATQNNNGDNRMQDVIKAGKSASGYMQAIATKSDKDKLTKFKFTMDTISTSAIPSDDLTQPTEITFN